MTTSFSQIIVLGNIGREPELGKTKGEKPVNTARFTVAENRKRGGQEVTTWYTVTAYGQDADFAGQFIHKGDTVMITDAHLVPDPETGGPRVWSGQDGKSKAAYEIEGRVKLIHSKNGAAAEQQAPAEDSPF